MKEKLEKRFNLIIAGIVIVILVAVGIPVSVNNLQTRTANGEIETVVSATEATSAAESTELRQATELGIKTYIIPNKPQAEKSEKKEKKTEIKETKPETEPETIKKSRAKKKPVPGFSYATAPTKSGVSYDAQWNAGYLVAIDNPDYGYHPPHIELSDADRDLLERLCYGEFGDGGFTGAALVAQCVKDAMYTYGLHTVKDVIKSFSYDGRTDHPGGQTIKDAVIYVFDMNKAAVQHRIIYMYDTKYVDSEFHETQNYVCTFKTTRFFDKK